MYQIISTDGQYEVVNGVGYELKNTTEWNALSHARAQFDTREAAESVAASFADEAPLLTLVVQAVRRFRCTDLAYGDTTQTIDAVDEEDAADQMEPSIRAGVNEGYGTHEEIRAQFLAQLEEVE